MKNVVIAVIALALISVAFLLGRRSVKPEIVKIHRTDTVVVRDTVTWEERTVTIDAQGRR